MESVFYVGGRRAVFSSRFDNGNLRRVELGPGQEFLLTPGLDNEGSDYEGLASNWFHFSVAGLLGPAKFRVRNLQILWPLLRNPDQYRPAVKTPDADWSLLAHPVDAIAYGDNDRVELQFSFRFESTGLHFLAFKVPWTYLDNQQFVQDLIREHGRQPHLYLTQEILIRSPEQRNIHLLCVSAPPEEGLSEREPLIEHLFPERRPRPLKLKRPVVLVTSRVHPVEVPSSHCVNGMLRFLVDKEDPRADWLRRNFVFFFVPMLNPDGVSRGHSRMDVYNQNLNRHYKNPDLARQPSCYAIRRLVQSLAEDKRLIFYCDLHAHPAFKGNFIFANAIQNFILQCESVTYLRVLSQNCPHFQFESCNFSKRQMKAKDYGEDLTKEGSGRVAIFEMTGVIHSYTLECGYHSYSLQTTNRVARLERTPDPVEEEDLLPGEIRFMTPQIYENLGKNVLVSILDVWGMNPLSRVASLNQLREEVANSLKKLDRFRRHEGQLSMKAKNIGGLIFKHYYEGWKESMSPLLKGIACKVPIRMSRPKLTLPASRKEEREKSVQRSVEREKQMGSASSLGKRLRQFQPAVLNVHWHLPKGYHQSRAKNMTLCACRGSSQARPV